jgi:peptidoglycan/LPS O-acetylase OafA/YrhL
LERTFVPDAASNPIPAPKPRRWTIFAAAFLILALALVVIYTSGRAFFSPLALVVVAAIGLAALLMQMRLRRQAGGSVRLRVALNVLGFLCAMIAVFSDRIGLSVRALRVAALGAVVCFALSGIVVLRALRKPQS